MSTVFNFEYALALHQQGELENAKNLYQQILDLDPHHYNSLHLLGLIHHQLGDSQTAASMVSQAISINATHSLMHSNLAAIFEKLQRWADALICWNKVIELEPKNHFAFHNRANIFVKLNKPYHAVLDYYHATALMPNFVEAHYSLGNLRLFELKHLDKALQSYKRALSIAPEQELLFGMYLQAKTNLCDWEGILEEFSEFEKKLEEQKPITVPFVALHITDRSDLHLTIAKAYAQIKNPSVPYQRVSLRQQSNRRLKIGYYSSDFRNHPVAHLIVELFELHNRDQFEIYGFSFFPGDKQTLNPRIYNSFDHFYDVSDMSEEQIVELSKKLDIDIAIDLNGYTQHAKTNIFSRRCAPLQVNYLGYPGTMGVNYYDYILADQIVIPECDQKNYTEKIIYLPNSYQINDRKRAIANRKFERKEFSLPQEAFVFCCFNHSYKIQPKLFDSWMRILSAVDSSVLWLLEDNPTASLNLKKEAQTRGVNPNRLIFAKRIRMDEHLARQQLADLFLDTLPYNAHTTASDALWVGLPVLTCLGNSFAGRVAASLLEAINMPELITRTPLDYEKKAIELALNLSKLTQIKSQLSINRNTAPLFDTENSVRNIELSYSKIYSRYEEGLDPISFHVES